MPFFTYMQNNNGGYFDKKYAQFIIIEAKNKFIANEKVLKIGLYFDGIKKGIDCSCCGNRWEPVINDNEGKETPLIFGKHPREHRSLFRDISFCNIYYEDDSEEIF